MTEDGTLRILHWNVHSWIDPESGESNAGLVEQAIRDLQPDVVSLVEVDEPNAGPSVLTTLADSLGYQSIFAPTFEYGDSEPTGAFGNALLTRLPIQSVRQWQLTWPDTRYEGEEESEPRTVVMARLQTRAGTVRVGSTHLPRGNAEYRDSALSRLFLRVQDGPGDWMICGDFNTGPPDNPAVMIAPSPNASTYPSHEPREPIDWAVTGSGHLQAEVLEDRCGSDHLPISIRWSPKAPSAFGNAPEEATTVDRRTLVSRAWGRHRLLYPWTPVLLEAGQRYWVDLDTDSLIVEDAHGQRRSFPGHYGDPAERPRS